MSSSIVSGQSSPQNIKPKSNKKNIGIGCAICIGAFVLCAAVSAIVNPDQGKKTTSNNPPTATVTATATPTPTLDPNKLTEQELTQYANAYCSNRKTKTKDYPLLHLIDKAPAGETQSNPNKFIKAGNKLTTEDCRGIVQTLAEYGFKERLESIINGKWGIGYDEIELKASIGYPDKINTTVTGNSKHEQYIYGDPLNGAIYIYVDDGKVTSYQSS